MKRLLAVSAFAVAVVLSSGEAGASVVAPVPAGPAFYSLPLAGWAGVVHNLAPVVQSQFLLNPRLLSLNGTLAQINLRLAENHAAGLGSMEFVRFMPKAYRERPEAFARLSEDRQVASLARGVRAAGRALDGEAAELAERARSGKAADSDLDRLAAILGNNFYLSAGIRQAVQEKIAAVTRAGPAAETIPPALRKLKEIIAIPSEIQGTVFDNAGRPSSNPKPASDVVSAAHYPPRRRPNGLAPSRAKSKDQGESMNTRSTKSKSRPQSASARDPQGTKARIIEALGLQPLPGEGGYYRETYRSETQVPIPSKNGEQPVIRHLGTAIYYFVTPEEFSALHKLKSDEVFHFYHGDPVEMLQISETGEVKTIILGPDVLAGHQPQVAVPAGTWQGTRLLKGGEYALLGTTVFPAFEFADFELGKRADLTARFPRFAAQIKRFTRE